MRPRGRDPIELWLMTVGDVSDTGADEIYSAALLYLYSPHGQHKTAKVISTKTTIRVNRQEKTDKSQNKI